MSIGRGLLRWGKSETIAGARPGLPTRKPRTDRHPDGRRRCGGRNRAGRQQRATLRLAFPAGRPDDLSRRCRALRLCRGLHASRACHPSRAVQRRRTSTATRFTRRRRTSPRCSSLAICDSTPSPSRRHRIDGETRTYAARFKGPLWVTADIRTRFCEE